MNTNTMLTQGTMLRNATYCVEKQLASGNYSNTYVVRHTAYDEIVVMKEFFMREINIRNGMEVAVELPEDQSLYEQQLSKFKKETRLLRRFDNPHIVKVHDIFEENNTAYYIMDYIHGKSVTEYLKNTGRPMSEQQTWQMLEQLLNALEEIHEFGIWHLDINPDNVMLDEDGNYILISFGASKQFRRDDSHLARSYYYASMEQIGQSFDRFGPWTDFYALGATLYYIQTLQNPPSIIDLIHGDYFAFPVSMSKKMRDLICWMMKPKKDERPCSVSEIEQSILPPYDCGPSYSPPTQSVEQRATDEEINLTVICDSDSHFFNEDDSLRRKRGELKRRLLEGKKISVSSINVTRGNQTSAISIPPGKLAGKPSIYSFEPTPKKDSSNSNKTSFWSRLFGKKRYDVVYSSVFAPAEVKPKSRMVVQVFLHLFKETEKVASLAKEVQIDAVRRDYIPLQCKLMNGDRVDVQLNIYGESLLLSDKKSAVWLGSFTKCSFDYFVPMDFGIDELCCVAILTVNGAQVGEMRFVTRVVEQPRELHSEVFARQYKKIFISYAHQDESKVKYIAYAYDAQGVDYFFDRRYLKPGDIFPLKIKEYIDSADLFVLCWSANAAQSDYVNLERKLALQRAFPIVKPIEDAPLTIYPMSIEPRTELPTDMRDTYNFEII